MYACAKMSSKPHWQQQLKLATMLNNHRSLSNEQLSSYGITASYEAALCSEGYMGPLCGSCMQGYGRQNFKCVECGVATTVIIFLVLCLYMFVLVLGAGVMHIKQTNQRFASLDAALQAHTRQLESPSAGPAAPHYPSVQLDAAFATYDKHWASETQEGGLARGPGYALLQPAQEHVEAEEELSGSPGSLMQHDDLAGDQGGARATAAMYPEAGEAARINPSSACSIDFAAELQQAKEPAIYGSNPFAPSAAMSGDGFAVGPEQAAGAGRGPAACTSTTAAAARRANAGGEVLLVKLPTVASTTAPHSMGPASSTTAAAAAPFAVSTWAAGRHPVFVQPQPAESSSYPEISVSQKASSTGLGSFMIWPQSGPVASGNTLLIHTPNNPPRAGFMERLFGVESLDESDSIQVMQSQLSSSASAAGLPPAAAMAAAASVNSLGAGAKAKAVWSLRVDKHYVADIVKVS
jgi:hypothetical protein